MGHQQRFVVRAAQDRPGRAVGYEMASRCWLLSRCLRKAVVGDGCGDGTSRGGDVGFAEAKATCERCACPTMRDKACNALLTQITSTEQARQIVRHYEQRWRIEEFHLAWKSGGTQVEKQRMQTADNLERMSVVLAFVAVRLIQIREVVMEKTDAKQHACTGNLWNGRCFG